MRVDQGVAIILYRVTPEGSKEYLVLKRDKNWTGWELPKGHLEFGSHKATVFVELNEETGLEPVAINRIEELDRSLTFSFEEDGEEVVSDFQAFRVEASFDAEVSTDNNPSDEHEAFAWLPVDEAIEKLEYSEQKDLLADYF